MSPALPVVSGREAVKALVKAGFVERRKAGSHVILRRDEPFAQVTVPDHKVRDRGTLRGIIRQTGLSVDGRIPRPALTHPATLDLAAPLLRRGARAEVPAGSVLAT